MHKRRIIVDKQDSNPTKTEATFLAIGAILLVFGIPFFMTFSHSLKIGSCVSVLGGGIFLITNMIIHERNDR